jgi:hypothetical protein
MPIKHVIVDWNGTLCDMVDDSIIMKRFAVAILRDHAASIARGHLFRALNVARFMRGRAALFKAKRRFATGGLSLVELYSPFNRDMLAGSPVVMLERESAGYGTEHAHLIDNRLLAPALAARDAGATLTIFSAAYGGGIRAILAAAGVNIDDIVSNTLTSTNGRAVALTAGFRDDKAGDFRREFIERRGWLAEDIVYAGDNEVDEPIATFLPTGNFVVPCLAAEPFRLHMRKAHGALTPNAPEELAPVLEI